MRFRAFSDCLVFLGISYSWASRNSTSALTSLSLRFAVSAEVISPGVARSSPWATKASGSRIYSVM